MIRLIIFFIYAAIIVILSIPIFVIGFIWNRIDRKSLSNATHGFIKLIYKGVLVISGVKTTVKGLENLPDNEEAVLYIGNHRSYFDILISYIYLPGHTGFIAKKEMERYPVLRTWMYHADCLFLDRNDTKEGLKTILAAIDKVKSGTSVFIFPEGSRNDSDTLLNFKEGSFKIAQKSGCRIIPVVQNNTNALLEDHFPKFKKAHTVIEFGKPIDMKELAPEDKKHIGAYVQNIMQKMYEENQALVSR